MPELKHIPLHEIDEPPLPMRAKMDDEGLTRLMNSIVNLGQHTPAHVKLANGRYEIITGHRRYVALQRLGRERMMCLVYGPEENADEALMVSENEDREAVNAAEQALFYAQLLDKHNLDEAGLCARVKRPADYIADRLRLLRKDSEVFTAVLEEKINFSVARELNRCDDEMHRRSFLDQAIRSGTSARVVKTWVDQWRSFANPAQQPTSQPTEQAPAPAAVPYHFGCDVCGGDRDPYNLITINVHKWEWEQMKAAWEAVNRGGA